MVHKVAIIEDEPVLQQHLADIVAGHDLLEVVACFDLVAETLSWLEKIIPT